MKYSIFLSFLKKNWLFVVKKNNKDFGFGSGSGFTFNCAARGSGRVGSDDLGFGSGSGFSLKPVQTSTLGYIQHYTGLKVIAH